MQVQILVKYNTNLTCTLDSIQPLDSNILIIDTTSSSEVAKIAKKYKAEIVVEPKAPYDSIRNKYIKSNDWNLYLDPGEKLVSGFDSILNSDKGHYSLQVINNNIISKETRLWFGNAVFQNPVYETLKVKGKVITDSLITGTFHYEDVADWQKLNITSSEPYYYQAFNCLYLKDYDGFIKHAEQYLFRSKVCMSSILMQYYMALIYFYVFKKHDKTINYLIPCLVANPVMAEFWCLFGDVYYDIHDYWRAKEFYSNALILGQKRPADDLFPVEILKYKNYPEIMLQSCREFVIFKNAH